MKKTIKKVKKTQKNTTSKVLKANAANAGYAVLGLLDFVVRGGVEVAKAVGGGVATGAKATVAGIKSTRVVYDKGTDVVGAVVKGAKKAKKTVVRVGKDAVENGQSVIKSVKNAKAKRDSRVTVVVDMSSNKKVETQIVEMADKMKVGYPHMTANQRMIKATEIVNAAQ